ncbi:MAG: hypothetical protein IBX72_16295, partial [Nitrospirae bacterium]|nr:hypothetical protein [Nitrospirota bacterium]
MIEKITKRDREFDRRIKRLPTDWLDYNALLILKNRGHGFAEFWKFVIYRQQRDIARSLFLAHSNQHSFVSHTIKRNAGQIVFSSQIIVKAYYLRYCVLLIQACGDKFAQLVRHALNIKKWRIKKKKGIEEMRASENNTTFPALIKHLEFNEGKPKPLFTAINSYLENESVKIIRQLANEIKHKWVTSYQGEGLSPIRNPIVQEKDNSGRLIKEFISIGMTRGINIDLHIRHALIVTSQVIDTTSFPGIGDHY